MSVVNTCAAAVDVDPGNEPYKLHRLVQLFSGQMADAISPNSKLYFQDIFDQSVQCIFPNCEIYLQ